MGHDRARIWFFTDLHGSTECFRKFLNTVGNENRPNVLLIGGDITGKKVVPIVLDQFGGCSTQVQGKQLRFPSARLPVVASAFEDVGSYAYACEEKDYRQFLFDEDFNRVVRHRLKRERLREWVKLADEKLPPPDVCQVIVNLGNDDSLDLDDILDTSHRMVRPEGKVLDLPCGLKLVSSGYSNITPWKCPRDVEEKELKTRIAAMTRCLAGDDLERIVFNFHCPPKNTSLDLAIKIDPLTLQPQAGFKGTQREHVGSSAVREAIEIWQPLVSLHGHIHESPGRDTIGRSICLNPGTDYQTGHLQGVFLQINAAGKVEVELNTHETAPDHPHSRSLLHAILSLIPIVGDAVRDVLTHKKLDELLERERDRRGTIGNAARPAQQDIPAIRTSNGAEEEDAHGGAARDNER
jgi:Icc-related predicted phosphoesterase